MKHYQSSDGLNIAYRDEGVGTPVICLAGLTRNSSDFDYLAPHLRGVRLIRPDYRGRGMSDWAENYLSYSIPVEARDTLELMNHLEIRQAAIIGTSRGGLIAMGLAGAVRERLLGVCLVDIGPEINSRGLEKIMDMLGRRPAQKTYSDAARARAKYMEGFANVPLSRWEEEARKHYIKDKYGLEINYDPKLRDAVFKQGAKPAPNVWPLFDALNGLPLALIRGANSDLLTRKTVSKMKQKRPDMIYTEALDRGHVPFLDEPESLDVINAFLEMVKI